MPRSIFSFQAAFAALVCLLTLPLFACAAVIQSTARDVAAVSAGSAPDFKNVAFINQTINVLNAYRKAHGAVRFTWSQAQADFAFQNAQKCAMKHSGGKYGENIYWVYSSRPLDFMDATKRAIDSWMSEQPLYKPDDPFEALHYTAVLWKKSTKVGCAWTRDQCSRENGGKGGYYFYCEFDPPGNVIGRFSQNVG